MKQIKPGMLCFLTGCASLPENNGRVVEVISTYVHEITKESGWLAKSATPMPVIRYWTDGSRRVTGNDTKIFVVSKQLIPIDADPNGTENEDWLILRRESCKPMHA